MKGGSFLALDPRLFDRAARALVAAGASISSDGAVVQLVDEDRLFNLYKPYPAEPFGEGIRGAPGVSLPDMTKVNECPFECRWEGLVARAASIIAADSEFPTWLLDGDDVMWNAASVDADKVRI